MAWTECTKPSFHNTKRSATRRSVFLVSRHPAVCYSFRMKPLILYVACSLDGYIADSDGGISFLEETSASMDDFGYNAFMSSVGSLIMGGQTYRQIVTELSPSQWPYEGKACYVYSRTATGRNEHAAFTSKPPAELLADIRREHAGAVWLVGGGEIIRLFMEGHLVDEYRLYVMPVVLGAGIPLFPPGYSKASLTLQSVKNIHGIVELIYTRT